MRSLVLISLLILSACRGAGVELPEDGERVGWEQAEALILAGEVEAVFQTHSLEVTLTLNNGAQVQTTEPSIDLVFRVAQECGTPCADILLVTE